MNKGIIIIGSPASGKTLLAKELASKYPDENVTWIDNSLIKSGSRFLFSGCHENTELVIFDDIEDSFQLTFMFGCRTGFNVHRQGEDRIFIEPKIIFTCQSHIFLEESKGLMNLIEANYEIIDLDKK